MDNVIIDLVSTKQYERAMKMAGGTYLERLKELGWEHEETQISMQQYVDLRDGNWK